MNSLEYEFDKNEKFTDMEIPVLKHSEIRDLCVYYGYVRISLYFVLPPRLIPQVITAPTKFSTTLATTLACT